jgi:hypothetical protein
MSKFRDLTDEKLGLKYLEDNGMLKTIKVEVDEMKDIISERIDDKGVDIKNQKGIEAGSVTMIKEKRVSISVENELASKLLEEKSLSEFIEKVAEIKIKGDVDKIPPKLIKDMDKYFDIIIHKTVDKDVMKMLLEKDKISQKDFEKVTSESITYAIKVKGK